MNSTIPGNQSFTERRARLGYILLVVGIFLLIFTPFLIVRIIQDTDMQWIVGLIVFGVIVPITYAGWLLGHPPIKNLTAPRNTKTWIGNFFLAAIWAVSATANWNEQSDPGAGWFAIGMFAFLLLLIIVRKLVLGYSFLESLGNLDAPASAQQPRDERESWVMSKASQYAFGINLLLTFVVAAILAFTPTVSAFAICQLFYAWLMVQIGIRHFIVWKLQR